MQFYESAAQKHQNSFMIPVRGSRSMADLHDVGEDACGGHTRTRTIAANHHRIIVVALGGE